MIAGSHGSFVAGVILMRVTGKFLFKGLSSMSRMQFYIAKTRTDRRSGKVLAVFACGKDEAQWCWVPVEFVVQLINQGVPFNTLLKSRNNDYVKGARVEVHDEIFLRTVANDTPGDNLESLPAIVE
ncbi:hypothetical protein D3C76_1516630 [compost metagenome]